MFEGSAPPSGDPDVSDTSVDAYGELLVERSIDAQGGR
jgi:hypothetical protein